MRPPSSATACVWNSAIQAAPASSCGASKPRSTALFKVNTSDWSKWTITDSGKKWQDLLGIQDWDGNAGNGWTTQLTATTAADGTINFNGYYGDYELTIGGQKYNLTLKKGTSR